MGGFSRNWGEGEYGPTKSSLNIEDNPKHTSVDSVVNTLRIEQRQLHICGCTAVQRCVTKL